MSYAQFGYPYHPASQLLVSGQTGTSPVAPSSCCESGRTVVTDPVTGQTVFSCQQCDTHSLVYPRLGSTVPSGPYAPYSEQTYPPVPMESSAFYSSLGGPYVLKEGANSDVSGWQSMAQPTGYYPYDPSLAAYGYGYDLNGARRKNATREATATLKAWLNEHKKNPYPTKGEKIMLAIITKMTLTQVSTWFANARRRLKKDNKITWDTKGKDDDDDDDEDGKLSDVDDDKDTTSDRLDSDKEDGMKANNLGYCEKPNELKHFGHDRLGGCNVATPVLGLGHGPPHRMPCSSSASTSPATSPASSSSSSGSNLGHTIHGQPLPRYLTHGIQHTDKLKDMPMMAPSDSPSHSQSAKPKIWSLADTATCKTPPTVSLACPQRVNCMAATSNSGFGGGPAANGDWASMHTVQRTVMGLPPVPPFQAAPSLNSYRNLHHFHNNGGSGIGDKSKHIGTNCMPAAHVNAMMTPGVAGCDVSVNGRPSVPCPNAAFNPELQTDTPPQTPPNHKFPPIANYGTVSSQGTAYSSADVYGGQRTLLSSVNSRLHEYQDDNVDMNYGNNQNVGSNSEPGAFKPVYKSALSNNDNLVIA